MKIFNEQVLKKGISLYNNQAIISLKVSDDEIIADIKDGRVHHVKYLINEKNKISQMNCTCQLGKPCRHEAALMYAIKEEHLLEIEENEEIEEIYNSSNDLKDLYTKLSKVLKTRRGVNNAFNKKINEMINEMIEEAKTYDYSYVLQIKHFIDNLSELDFLSESEYEVLESLFIDAYARLMKISDQYCVDILIFLCKDIVGSDYSNYKVLLKHDHYKNLLKYIKERMDNETGESLIAYFMVLKENESSYTNGLKELKEYKDTVEYTYFYIQDLLENELFYDAKVCYTKFIEARPVLPNELMRLAKLGIDNRYSMIDYYIDDLVEEMYNRTAIAPISKMEKRFGKDWDLYKDTFYDRLKRVDGPSRFQQVIKKKKEWEYIVKTVSRFPRFSTLFEWADDIESYSREMYLTLYVMCLEEEINSLNRRYYVFSNDRIGYYITSIKRQGYGDYVNEIVEYIMSKYEDDDHLCEYLEYYLEGEDPYEIGY